MDSADRDKRIGTSTVQHWSVIHLDWYYRFVNKWNDEVWQQPKSAAEEQHFIEQGYEKTFGKLGYLNFGPLHATQFDDSIMKTIQRMCGGCEYDIGHEARYDGGLEPAIIKCEKCSCVVEDLKVSSWTGQQIDAVDFGEADIECPECGHVGIAKVEYGCVQCKEPTQVDLFETVIPLSKYVSKTEGGKTQSSITIPTGKQIVYATDFKLPNGEHLSRVNPAGELEMHPEISKIYHPIDFKEELFKLQFNPEYQLTVTEGALGSTGQGFTARRK